VQVPEKKASSMAQSSVFMTSPSSGFFDAQLPGSLMFCAFDVYLSGSLNFGAGLGGQ
jgi:hypothetical protein